MQVASNDFMDETYHCVSSILSGSAQPTSSKTRSHLLAVKSPPKESQLQEPSKIKPQMVDAAVQYEPPRTSLHSIDFNVLNPDLAPDGAPEKEPYSGITHPGILTRTLGRVASTLYSVATSTAVLVRSYFWQTEFELLMALADENTQVRVTRSWFFKGEREHLYGLSNGWFSSVFCNMPKMLYNEKFPRFDVQFLPPKITFEKSHTFALLKVTPHVICNKLDKIAQSIKSESEVLIRKAEVVLSDPNGYDNIEYLTMLEGQMARLLTIATEKTAPFLISGTGGIATTLERVKKALGLQVNKAFPAGGSNLDQEVYRLDSYTTGLEQSFKFGKDYAKENAADNLDVKLQLGSMPKTTADERKDRIHMLAQTLIQLRERSINISKQFDIFLKEQAQLEQI